MFISSMHTYIYIYVCVYIKVRILLKIPCNLFLEKKFSHPDFSTLVLRLVLTRRVRAQRVSFVPLRQRVDE